ncbi:MAG: hypothetical protein ACREQB_10085 [Candidatus Binataceae bacterium]
MLRSAFFAAALAALASLASCSSQEAAPPPPAPPPAAHTAALDITPGIRVIANVELPPGFTPIPQRRPLWLLDGAEIGIAGLMDGHAVMIGMSGKGWRNTRILAAEYGPAAPIVGEILDVAASPDGMALASVVAVPGENRIELVVRDVISANPGHAAASIEGAYQLASLAWLTTSSLALALKAGQDPDAPARERDSGSLQIVVLSGAASVVPLKVSCPMSELKWNPRRTIAVGQGDAIAPPILVERRGPACRPLNIAGPIRVLAWAGDNSSFLFVEAAGKTQIPAVFRYDLKGNRSSLIAMSSGAAAFTSDDSVIAYGNRNLTMRTVEDRPDEPVAAEVALMDLLRGTVNIKSLGFRSVAPLLAQSTMTYSLASDRAAIQTFGADADGPPRRIIVFSVPTQRAFLVGYGGVAGSASMSWSPKGSWLAIVDATPNASTLTIIEPAR